jgi:hypothetical protein
MNCHMPYTVYGLLKTSRSHHIDSPQTAVTVKTGRPNACNLCHLDKTLAWTGEKLTAWYGQPAADLQPEDRRVAQALLMLLKGDAGQRALAAAAMGRKDPQAASGANWLSPFLAASLNEPYDAVRYIIARSLRTTPGFADYEFDFVAEEDVRKEAAEQGIEEWKRRRPAIPAHTGPALLLSAHGEVDRERMKSIIADRDETPIELHE